MEELFLAVDPGREKTGIAIVNSSCQPVYLQVASSANLADALYDLHSTYNISDIMVGNGTYHECVLQIVKTQFAGYSIQLVDEKNTTLQARKLYWQYNKPSFWQSLLPFDWRSTPPLDAYAALAIAICHLQGGLSGK